ncbi:MAG: glycosyl hydrolase [Chloroflexi bacterium]|nr:glycosyl hydrolase [Chloroflexota bacterium]
MASPEWRCIGPHRGGRVVAVAGDTSDPMTFYFGACAGGIWKTTDGGTYWQNISDGFFATAAIGAIAVSESDPNVIYAGTGESCIRNDVSHGDGVYKSTDGGKMWQNVGLRHTRHIGAIRIHPDNPDLVYVAALGHAWGPNEERGVFRSKDGGTTWQRVLYKSARAGSHDLAMDPKNPRILYAAIWQAQRYPHTLVSGGPECGLWKSTDGGDTWTDLTRRPGLPMGELGKIGVAVSPAQPDRVWALVEAADGALFRSDDGGDTWLRVNEESYLRTRPWYYIHVYADTRDPDTCWVLNYRVWKSIDGGATFSEIPTPHGDNHDLWIHPQNPRRMIEGNDGGACVTFNGGASWSSIYNQPTAQLYHVTTDNQFPYRVYGSQQDNSAISIPSISLHGAIHERDWYAPGGGESGYIAIKPDNPNIVVASGPAGRRVTNDVMSCYDHRTRQRRDITVWPELFGWGVGAIDLKYRLNWTFPILFSQHDPDALYVAGNRVFLSRDLGASWEVLSDDLTRNDASKLGSSGGLVTRDNTGAEVYCTIFALVESPHEPRVFWAGSDDGLVHLSRDGGRTWQNVTPSADLLPEWALISIIEVSPHDPATAYIAATRYKHDDTRPYVLKTGDYGSSWRLITRGIPEDEFTRVVREDPNHPGLLYAGTETGIYVSFDRGEHWQRFGGNLPVVPVHDLVIKGVEMVVATHGRSFWVLDDLTPVHQLAGAPAAARVHLFQPRPTVRLRAGGHVNRSQPPVGMVGYGRADTSLYAYTGVKKPDGTVSRQLLDAGANPPTGVVFQYFLPEEPPGELRLDVLDAEGQSIRAFSSKTASDVQGGEVTARAGVNRFVWNMRYPGVVRVAGTDLEAWHRDDGPMALPGAYQVCLTADGASCVQPFEILPDPRISTSVEDLQAQFDLQQVILERLAATNDLVNRIGLLQSQIDAWERWTAGRDGTESLRTAMLELKGELAAMKPHLIDVNMRQAQLHPSGLHEKLNALFDMVDGADYGPPQQARDVLAVLSAQMDEQVNRFPTVVEGHVRAVTEAFRSANVPLFGAGS